MMDQTPAMAPERPTAPRDPLVKGSLLHVALAHHYALQAIAQGGLSWEERYDPAAPPSTGKVLLDAGPSSRGWHFYEAFLRCPQFWAYRYLVDNQRTRLPAVRAVKLKTAADIFTPQEAPRELAWRQGEWQDAWTKHLVLVAAMYQAHAARYGDSDKAWRIVAVEQELRADIDGIPYTQRADLILCDADGRVWLWDHKTAGRPSDRTSLLGFTMSGQFLGYKLLGQKLWGDQFGGVKINLIGTQPPFTMLRTVPEAAPWAQAHFIDTIRRANDDMVRLEGLEAWEYPKVLSDQVCIGRYGPCDYIERCRWGKL